MSFASTLKVIVTVAPLFTIILVRSALESLACTVKLCSLTTGGEAGDGGFCIIEVDEVCGVVSDGIGAGRVLVDVICGVSNDGIDAVRFELGVGICGPLNKKYPPMPITAARMTAIIILFIILIIIFNALPMADFDYNYFDFVDFART